MKKNIIKAELNNGKTIYREFDYYHSEAEPEFRRLVALEAHNIKNIEMWALVDDNDGYMLSKQFSKSNGTNTIYIIDVLENGEDFGTHYADGNTYKDTIEVVANTVNRLAEMFDSCTYNIRVHKRVNGRDWEEVKEW